MLLSVASHETAPASQLEGWQAQANNFFDSASGVLERAAESVGDGISSAYNWTKGEVKGAADYATGFFSSTLVKVALIAVAAIVIYFIVRKEVSRG